MANKPVEPNTVQSQVDAGLPAVEINDVPGETVETTDDWTEPAKVEAKADDEKVETAPETPAAPADEVDYKSLIETMDRELAANPTNLLTNLAKTANLSDVQKAELVRQLLPQADEKYVPDDFEPQGLLEPQLIKHNRLDWIFKGEKLVEDQISKARQEIAPFVDNANQEVAILRAEVEALKQVAGMNLSVDREAIQKEIQAGSNFNKAVEKVMKKTIDAEVKKAVQANRDRPNTPGPGGSDLMERKPGMPMTAYLQAAKNGALPV